MKLKTRAKKVKQRLSLVLICLGLYQTYELTQMATKTYQRITTAQETIGNITTLFPSRGNK